MFLYMCFPANAHKLLLPFLQFFLQNSGMIQPTWERDEEMRESLFLFRSVIVSSPKLRPAMSILICPACSVQNPPRFFFPSTVPLCLCKHERELIVFKVPRQASDALGHQVFIRKSAAGNTAWTRRLSAHVSAAALPDAKCAVKSCLVGQWPADL